MLAINQSLYALAPSLIKEWSIVLGKTTWNALESVKTNNLNY